MNADWNLWAVLIGYYLRSDLLKSQKKGVANRQFRVFWISNAFAIGPLGFGGIHAFLMNYDYSKRDYLLPQGCKDLIDVWKLDAQKKAREEERAREPVAPRPLPPISGELVVPEPMTVLQLASILNRKPFQIIADLMELGVFANVNCQLDFDTIARVARRHGYTARKAAG